MLENLAKQHLTKEAISRYYNIKAAHPELAVQVLAMLASFLQTNQIKEKITDEQFKNILKQIQPPKKEFKIHRK
tara:strand:+ start:9565 stop:9786 length:222 start_codon:yes stop_codon:yes gene_type:complete